MKQAISLLLSFGLLVGQSSLAQENTKDSPTDTVAPVDATESTPVETNKPDPEEVLKQLTSLGLVNDSNRDVARTVIKNQIARVQNTPNDSAGFAPDINMPSMIASALKENGIVDLSDKDLSDLKSLKTTALGDTQGPVVGHKEVENLKMLALRIHKYTILKDMAELHAQIYLIQKEATSRGYQIAVRWLDKEGRAGMPIVLGSVAAGLWIVSVVVRNSTSWRKGFVPVTFNHISSWTARMGWLSLGALVVGYALSGGQITDSMADFVHVLNMSDKPELQNILQQKLNDLAALSEQRSNIINEESNTQRELSASTTSTTIPTSVHAQ